MAVLTPELEREIIRAKLEKEARVAAKAALKANKEERELSAIENAALTADINKIMAGRDAWLKQMRDAKTRQKRSALKPEDEKAINDEANRLLEEARNFIANYKYKSEDTPDANPKNANETGLKGMLSNFSSGLGLGDNPIFNFLGKLISFIMNLITGVQETFNPKKTPADVVADLVKEESFDNADAELKKQENELIQKLEAIAHEDQGVKGITEQEKIRELVEKYKEKLKELKNDLKVDSDVVPFSKTTDDNKKEILQTRISMFNEISSKTAAALSAHKEAATANNQYKLKEEQKNRLEAEAVADSPEHSVFTERIAAVVGELKELEAKRDRSIAKENGCLAQFGHVKNIVSAYDFTSLSTQEIQRQKALALKATDDARKAEELAEKQHQRQMDLARAHKA